MDWSAGSNQPMISFKLDKEEAEGAISSGRVKFTIILRDANGSSVKESTIESSDISFDCKDFIEQNKLLCRENNIILRGGLHVDLLIEPEHDVVILHGSSQDNLLHQSMIKALDEWEMCDVLFQFPMKQDRTRDRMWAHKTVLAIAAPGVLANLCGANPIIELGDSDSYDVFRHMIRYIYGAGLPEKEYILQHGMDIIRLADKYGIVRMKLEVEQTLVASRIVDVNNVVLYLLDADAYHCALLKEYALSVFMARRQDVMKSESFMYDMARSPKLVGELINHAYGYGSAAVCNHNDFETMVLRRKLVEVNNLDIDGSIEMLRERVGTTE